MKLDKTPTNVSLIGIDYMSWQASDVNNFAFVQGRSTRQLSMFIYYSGLSFSINVEFHSTCCCYCL
jgi:hypothetical protein